MFWGPPPPNIMIPISYVKWRNWSYLQLKKQNKTKTLLSVTIHPTKSYCSLWSVLY